MGDLINIENNLPVSIEDLSKFVLIGDDKLQAVKAEISAIKKLGLAKEVHEQKLREGQEIAEMVTLAKIKMGELLNSLPKATKGTGGNRFTSAKDREIESPVDFSTKKENSDDESEQDNICTENIEVDTPKIKPKSEVIKEIGFTQKQAEQLQQMAKNPEIVHAAMAEARENGDIVSQSSVMKAIQESKKPYILSNSGNNERYTPKEYIDAARLVMGSIDLDPASSELANKVVQAKKIYTAEDDGLIQDWYGNIWLNPPYAKDLLPKFADKFAESSFNQAIVLVHNATETKWFAKFICKASAVVFPTGRVDCKTPGENHCQPLQGSAFIYSGNNPDEFMKVFKPFGWGAKL